jgi:hypothetical protein
MCAVGAVEAPAFRLRACVHPSLWSRSLLLLGRYRKGGARERCSLQGSFPTTLDVSTASCSPAKLIAARLSVSLGCVAVHCTPQAHLRLLLRLPMPAEGRTTCSPGPHSGPTYPSVLVAKAVAAPVAAAAVPAQQRRKRLLPHASQVQLASRNALHTERESVSHGCVDRCGQAQHRLISQSGPRGDPSADCVGEWV